MAYYDATAGWGSALGLSDADINKKMLAYLEDALKHPTPAAYRVHAYALVWQFKFDQAIAELERAIALDPSDANSYAAMGEALIDAGRTADGKGYIDAAFRLDPRSVMWRHYYEGLVYFSLNQFEAAAAALRKDRSTVNTMTLELSSYGHLGRSSEAASLLQELNDHNAKLGWPKMTVLFTRGFWQFRENADRERLLDGLRKAGVPELPPDYDTKRKDELTGEEVKSLAFGHEFRGQQIGSGDAYSRTTSADGVANVSIGSWFRDAGISHVEDDALCTWFSTAGYGCAVIFRNPAGTFEQKNQYIWVTPELQLEFSVVK